MEEAIEITTWESSTFCPPPERNAGAVSEVGLVVAPLENP